MTLLPLLLAGLAAPVPAQQPDLAVRVDAAIDRGVEALLVRQNRDGSWTPDAYEEQPHWDHSNALTAFVLYTLLKCDLPRDHPAVLRAEAYLLQDWPTRTYSIGTQLMALGALRDEAHHERMDVLVEALMDIRGRGATAWPYPEHGAGVRCLSNTQYAALGLRAAHQAGRDLPGKVWDELIEATLDLQGEIEREGGVRRAGFRYDESHGVTGAMTTAGLSILGLAAEAEGEGLPRRWEVKIEEARELGFEWLARHWSVEGNPAGPMAWHYYYLYGLERLGSVLGLVDIAGHDWYREGAEFLVRIQRQDGTWSTPGSGVWPPMPMVPANTCFALLFLSRASRAPISGKTERKDLFIAEAPTDAVWLRAFGQSELTAYVSGFGEGIVDAYPDPAGEVTGLRVLRVEYWVDGALASTVEADPTRGWAGERFPFRHEFDTPGAHSLEARVVVLAGRGEQVTLHSRTHEFTVERTLEPWMLVTARDRGSNVLREVELEATSSSAVGPRWDAPEAVDGTHLSAWIAAPDDPEPAWTVELKRPVRGRRLFLGQVDASPAAQGRHPRIVRVRVRVDRNKPFEVELDPDPLLRTEIDLERTRNVRRLEVVLLEWTGGEPGQGPGLSEVELLP